MSDLPYTTLHQTYPTSDLSYVRPTLHCPMSDLPYVALCQTYPTLPYIGPTLHHPTSDLPYVGPILPQTHPMSPYVRPPYVGPTLPPYIRPTLLRTYPMSDLPYGALHQTCSMPVTYPMLPYTYSTPSSLSVQCLRVISGCDPLCILAEPSGA